MIYILFIINLLLQDSKIMNRASCPKTESNADYMVTGELFISLTLLNHDFKRICCQRMDSTDLSESLYKNSYLSISVKHLSYKCICRMIRREENGLNETSSDLCSVCFVFCLQRNQILGLVSLSMSSLWVR